ncbi:MAG TPA: N-acetylglucosamine-6-phosphate deacetylase [Gammaproteobacteria bacterium]|nr:N-acetylglucosamine-6-phosphate deacetylase [Gammaproteobacteria bacterium]HBX26408.1 N-acetylglucosamine-6-phosphate deacetylase [Gammaproteobacteria bacterium]
MNELVGQIVTANGVVEGCLQFNQTIVSINELASSDQRIILPGMIDCHIHGGGGGDVMDGLSGIRSLGRTHVKFGLTGFLATTVTADNASIEQVLDAAIQVMDNRMPADAKCLGVHLEGPYLSNDELGAQPPCTRLVEPMEAEAWFQRGCVKVMTYAPEQDPDNVLPEIARAHGVKLQIGHSGCGYHKAHELFGRGCGVTHLFNAMSGMHHRNPGVASAALLTAEYAEIISDGIHVTEPAFQLARGQIPNLYSVTDSTSAAGMPDGEYQLGTHKVFKKNEAVTLRDGTMAGGAATADHIIKTLRKFGLDWVEIGLMTSTRPANWLGLNNVGQIRPGALADLVTYRDGELESVWIEGTKIF